MVEEGEKEGFVLKLFPFCFSGFKTGLKQILNSKSI
jgi:hypothetical protein